VPRDKNAPVLTTWADVLAYALAQLDQANTKHRLTDVSMGTYADSVGGGHWCDLRFGYTVGSNTSDHAQTKEHRIKMVVDEWTKRQAGDDA
jgi:hypothetical protein